MGNIVFKEGEECAHIAIVKAGTFEVRKKIPA